MRGKIIEIEGTDCSGKKTQSEMLKDRMIKNNIKATRISFPSEDSPIGKIINGPFLGRTDVCKEGSWFKEGADNVPKKLSATLFILDRYYTMPEMMKSLSEGHVICDRYVDSNLAYNASNLDNKKERFKMYKWLEDVEYKTFGNPKADIKILLHVPFEVSEKLKLDRKTKSIDEYESNATLMKRSERAYMELAKRNHYQIIECTENGKLLSKEEIHEKVWDYVCTKL